LHTSVNTNFFECILERERVHNGCEHAHVVGGRAVDTISGTSQTTKDIARTNDDRNLGTSLVDGLDLRCYFERGLGINAVFTVPQKTFSTKFEKHALKV